MSIEEIIERKMAMTEPKIKKRGGKYRVKLSNCGNPDYRQDPDQPLPETICAWAHVADLAEASRLCRHYIAYFDLGGGNWDGGDIEEVATGLQIGYVSYNGRVWAGHRNDWKPEMNPLYEP